MKRTRPKGSKPAPGPVAAKPEDDYRKAIDPTLVKEVGDFLEDPDRWFRTPNVIFELRAPIELLGTPEEARIRERVEAAKHGIFT